MSELVLHKFSYKDLREKKYKDIDDPYNIVGFMTDHLRETLLACPNNDDDSKTAFYVMTDDGVAVARELQFGTKLKINKEILPAQAGGSLYVKESYRPMGIGAEILMEAKTSKDYDIKINSLFSTMVVPMYKRMKYVFYDIPQFVFINDTKPILESRGIKGNGKKAFAYFTNFPIRILKLLNNVKRKRLLKKYDVQKMTIIPKWVETMVLNDQHKYMELHNQEWFQWNLDYNYNGFPGDKQGFYAVYDKTGEPKGFFMIKERFEENTCNYHNIIRGTIVEWATIDDNLSEADLNLLALFCFSPTVFMIHTVTTSNKTVSKLKKIGFVRHRLLQMNLYDKKKRYDDIENINLWRIRYGCCNTVIFGEDRILYN